MKNINGIHENSGSRLPEIFYPLNERDLNWYYMYLVVNIPDAKKSRYNVIQNILAINNMEGKKAFDLKLITIKKAMSESWTIDCYLSMIYLKNMNTFDNTLWIKKSQRAMLFLSFIYVIKISQLRSDNYLFHVTSELRYQAVILYFDAIFFLEFTKEYNKFKFMDGLYVLFKSNLTSNTDLSWLSKKDDIQLDWAWEYMVKSDIIKELILLSPTTSCEKYSMIVAALDFINIHKNYVFTNIKSFVTIDSFENKLWSKKEFLIKFKKAWQQKNRRKIAKSTQKKISRE